MSYFVDTSNSGQGRSKAVGYGEHSYPVRVWIHQACPTSRAGRHGNGGADNNSAPCSAAQQGRDGLLL